MAEETRHLVARSMDEAHALAPPGWLIFGSEYGTGQRDFLVVPNAEYARVRVADGRWPHIYPIVAPSLCHYFGFDAYFDIDGKLPPSVPEAEGEVFLRTVIDSVIEHATALWPAAADKLRFCVLTATVGRKLSIHLYVVHPDAAFATQPDMARYCRNVILRAQHTVPGTTLTAIDPSVYSKDRNFRPAGSRKVPKPDAPMPAPLVPLPPAPGSRHERAAYTDDAFLGSLILRPKETLRELLTFDESRDVTVVARFKDGVERAFGAAAAAAPPATRRRAPSSSGAYPDKFDASVFLLNSE